MAAEADAEAEAALAARAEAAAAARAEAALGGGSPRTSARLRQDAAMEYFWTRADALLPRDGLLSPEGTVKLVELVMEATSDPALFSFFDLLCHPAVSMVSCVRHCPVNLRARVRIHLLSLDAA